MATVPISVKPGPVLACCDVKVLKTHVSDVVLFYCLTVNITFQVLQMCNQGSI